MWSVKLLAGRPAPEGPPGLKATTAEPLRTREQPPATLAQQKVHQPVPGLGKHTREDLSGLAVLAMVIVYELRYVELRMRLHL